MLASGDLNAPELIEDIRPFEDFVLTPDRGTINIWMGQAGVIAHTHLVLLLELARCSVLCARQDSYDNFFVQLHGRKRLALAAQSIARSLLRCRFLLFKTEQSRFLHPYPFLHPSHAQAQVKIEQPDLAAFPDMANIECLEANLDPGDVLCALLRSERVCCLNANA